MKILFMGSGTSTGVPQIGCRCEVCRSTDPRDKRLRASVVIETRGRRLLVDCGPDLRTQLLEAGAPKIDALLVTHSHYDHIGGLIDLRTYCADKSLPVYCRSNAAHELRQFFPYCFADDLYPGVPTFDIHEVSEHEKCDVCGVQVEALPVLHYKMPIYGYKIGKMAYITDCKTMPTSTLEAIKGLDTLVINALRIEPHMSHMDLEETLAVIAEARPRVAWLTHMSHDMGLHRRVKLPAGVHLAWDGLQIDVPD